MKLRHNEEYDIDELLSDGRCKCGVKLDFDQEDDVWAAECGECGKIYEAITSKIVVKVS
jgi:hypothetical protein